MKDTQKGAKRKKGKENEDGFLKEKNGQEEEEEEEEGEDTQVEEAANNKASHKNYNFLNSDWFKETPISHYLTWQLVIGLFVNGQFNKPITFKILV